MYNSLIRPLIHSLRGQSCRTLAVPRVGVPTRRMLGCGTINHHGKEVIMEQNECSLSHIYLIPSIYKPGASDRGSEYSNATITTRHAYAISEMLRYAFPMHVIHLVSTSPDITVMTVLSVIMQINKQHQQQAPIHQHVPAKLTQAPQHLLGLHLWQLHLR
jgi:hypothetical protein